MSTDGSSDAKGSTSQLSASKPISEASSNTVAPAPASTQEAQPQGAEPQVSAPVMIPSILGPSHLIQ